MASEVATLTGPIGYVTSIENFNDIFAKNGVIITALHKVVQQQVGANMQAQADTQAAQLFHVFVQGWGDDEDAMELIGTCNTMPAAEAKIEKALQDWEAMGLDRADVVYEIIAAELV